MPQDELIQVMRHARFYPGESSVEFLQTHISCLFLTAEHVYKLKKSVNLGFLDFSTLEKRRFYCHEEVRLNSRLAPPVYLGVLAVSRNQNGEYFLGQDPASEIVDYVVHMRRLSEDSMFPALLKQGRVDEEMLSELAGLLSDFHAHSPAVQASCELGSPQLIRNNIEENFEQTEMLKGKALSAKRHRIMHSALLWSLRRHQELLTVRHDQGRTRECHGDLRMEHICRFEGRLVAFDCIEFNERFRYIDTAADVAFLLMDMEFSGHWSLAAALLHFYVRATQDHDALTVMPLYKAYYALTRGKIFGIESTEQEFTTQERQEALDMASKFLDLAWSYAIQLQTPTLILLSGLMGTGKTALGRHLSQKLGAELIRSDVVRKTLHGLDPQARETSDYGQGLYTPKATQDTYQALVEQAAQKLNSGQSVIVDASFSRRTYRRQAYDMARSMGVRFILLECVCPEEVIRKRLEHRQARESDASDGRTTLFEAQKADFQPINELDPHQHVSVNTADAMERLGETAIEAVLEALCRQEGY
ncbi:MAG: AAA family ATPase [Desulfovermiculus sp.]